MLYSNDKKCKIYDITKSSLYECPLLLLLDILIIFQHCIKNKEITFLDFEVLHRVY